MHEPLTSRKRAGVCLALAAAISFFALAVTLAAAKAQSNSTAVKIEAHADHNQGAWHSIWNFWGYDEPNYTYASNGTKLLREFVQLSPDPVYIRVHNLFTTGNGDASLKWGSTNVYTEDASGQPVYNWTILDHIFDTFHETGVKPLVQLGFMP